MLKEGYYSLSRQLQSPVSSKSKRLFQTRAHQFPRETAYTADGTRHHRIGEEAWRGTL
ncbi:hypothetical protein ALC62_10489 [Cyphomyrmex costatus]|uniref:Uncharacterized protein n=1 Tax=Cyphomyrmex costatus TaxID=456900 RepID=A0A151IDR6_9HYME|nr:hypothetical protein ALC62_10489 [Cyphomyrmex costatus]